MRAAPLNPPFQRPETPMRIPPPSPHSAGPLVLIVEDDAEIAEILAAYLQHDAFRFAHAADGNVALELHHSLQPDLILLDIQMPHLNGWEVLSEVRRRGETPVIMLTAHDDDIDKLTGLRIGADDYVVKPFNPAEVVARVAAVLRRANAGRRTALRKLLQQGPLELDLESYQACVRVNGRQQPLNLTLTEFRLLAQLARSPQKVFSRAELLEACRSEGNALERTIDSHISKLRKKLEEAGISGMPSGLRGVGYRLGVSG